MLYFIEEIVWSKKGKEKGWSFLSCFCFCNKWRGRKNSSKYMRRKRKQNLRAVLQENKSEIIYGFSVKTSKDMEGEGLQCAGLESVWMAFLV